MRFVPPRLADVGAPSNRLSSTGDRGALGRFGTIVDLRSRAWSDALLLRIACILIAAGALVSSRGRLDRCMTPRWCSSRTKTGPNGSVMTNRSVWRRSVQQQIVGFGKTIDVGAGRERAVLHVRALRSLKVLVDGELVFSSGVDPVPWNQRYEIDLAPRLSPGRREIALLVGNDTGPPSVLAYSEELGNPDRPGLGRPASTESAGPQPGPSSQVRSSTLSREFQRVDQAFLASLPVLGRAFLIVFLGVALRRKAGVAIEPSVLRWLLLAAWALLGINNLARLPLYLGFDATGHLDYIRASPSSIGSHLPTEGWTMFQAPLYYLISAPLYASSASLCSPGDRLASAASGAARQWAGCDRGLLPDPAPALARRCRPPARRAPVRRTLPDGLLPVALRGKRDARPRCCSRSCWRSPCACVHDPVSAKPDDAPSSSACRSAWPC